MAHELTLNTAGAAEMAYVGAKPWHGLGQQLTAGATIEEWKVAAGMAWHIRRAQVRYFADEDQRADCFELMNAADESVLFRSDSRAKLGIVSPDYEIVQPGQVLEFFRDLVSDHGMALESAGTLFGGRRFWALAKMGAADVAPGDTVGGYLLLSTSADGTMATEARQTTVRVVCNNTLRLARSEDGAAPVPPVKLSHRTAFCDKRVKAQLGLARDNFARGIEDARILAERQVTSGEAAEFVRRLLRPEEFAQKARAAEMATVAAQAAAAVGTAPGGEFAALMARAMVPVDVEPDKRAPRGEGAILDLFGRTMVGGHLPGAAGTAWGLVNAVTEYVDHHATARSTDHRAASAWYGAGDELKTRALDCALQMARS
jgi:phage/plasmid-like protein (TIGR03299 family)